MNFWKKSNDYKIGLYINMFCCHIIFKKWRVTFVNVAPIRSVCYMASLLWCSFSAATTWKFSSTQRAPRETSFTKTQKTRWRWSTLEDWHVWWRVWTNLTKNWEKPSQVRGGRWFHTFTRHPTWCCLSKSDSCPRCRHPVESVVQGQPEGKTVSRHFIRTDRESSGSSVQ